MSWGHSSGCGCGVGVDADVGGTGVCGVEMEMNPSTRRATYRTGKKTLRNTFTKLCSLPHSMLAYGGSLL